VVGAYFTSWWSPAFRLTEIRPPTSDNSVRLQQIGWRLVQFEHRGFVANDLDELDA